MKNKILHILQNEKFISSYINFIADNLKMDDHLFIIIGGESKKQYPIPDYQNILVLEEIYTKKSKLVQLSKKLNPYLKDADKVIIHSLFIANIVDYLFFNQRYLHKCHWVIWGGDLYDYKLAEKSLLKKLYIYRKKTIVKKMGHIITYLKGDYELAQEWYGAKGEYHECFMYPSNLYKDYNVDAKQHKTVNIQVGNSADPTNNHLEVFERLKQYRDEDINIYVPLSYGNKEYALEVIDKGKELFGDKFKPMTDFMPFEEYLKFLGDIDIAIFAHKRQQAMGNTITLLGLGKKLYMRNDITPRKLFEDIDVKVFSVDDISMNPISNEDKNNNQKRIKEYFSKENYIKQLNKLFED